MTHSPSANGKRCSRRSGRSSSWITKHKRLAIYLRDGFVCMYCGTDLHSADARNVTLDHLECQNDNPSGFLRNGLSVHDESNLVTACAKCNCGRSDLVAWHKFATPGAKARIQNARRRSLKRFVYLAKAIIAGDVPVNVALLENR